MKIYQRSIVITSYLIQITSQTKLHQKSNVIESHLMLNRFPINIHQKLSVITSYLIPITFQMKIHQKTNVTASHSTIGKLLAIQFCGDLQNLQISTFFYVNLIKICAILQQYFFNKTFNKDQ